MFDKFVNLKIFYEFDLDKLCFFFCFIFFYFLIKKETNSKIKKSKNYLKLKFSYIRFKNETLFI